MALRLRNRLELGSFLAGVMAGLVPAIPIDRARFCPPKRDHRDKFTAGLASGRTRLPGDDEHFSVIPGRTDRCEPGIQMAAQSVVLDSGSAAARRPGMTIAYAIFRFACRISSTKRVKR